MIPFTLENVTDFGLGDEMVITFEPVVSVLPDVGRVVTGFDGTDVVDHSKKRIPDEPKWFFPSSVNRYGRSEQQGLHVFGGNEWLVKPIGSISGRIDVVVDVTTVRHEWAHVQILWKGDE